MTLYFWLRTTFGVKRFCNFSEDNVNESCSRGHTESIGMQRKAPGGLNGMVRDLSLPTLELRGSGAWHNTVSYIIPVT